MVIIILILLHVFIAWRWGDWLNWTRYQSTILYMIVCDYVYNILTYNHSLWEYEPTFFLPNHTLTNLMQNFIGYPAVIFVLLGRYPNKWFNQLLWLVLWISVESFFEWICVKLDLMSYHNGWTFISSVLFNVALYSMLRLHYKKPLLTYGLTVLVTVGLVIIFKIPISSLK